MLATFNADVTIATHQAWGVVDLDWSNGKEVWANQSPMTTEEMLVKQAVRTHSI